MTLSFWSCAAEDKGLCLVSVHIRWSPFLGTNFQLVAQGLPFSSLHDLEPLFIVFCWIEYVVSLTSQGTFLYFITDFERGPSWTLMGKKKTLLKITTNTLPISLTTVEFWKSLAGFSFSEPSIRMLLWEDLAWGYWSFEVKTLGDDDCQGDWCN